MHFIKSLTFVFLATVTLFPCLVSAAPAQSGNAAPFGLELGVANYSQVKKSITDVTDSGTNTYSGGRMLQANGEGLEVEGLKGVVFIFDKSDVLVGAVLTMAKDPKGMTKVLAGKYRQVSNNVDTLMNYGSARFEKGDSLIEINAPHLSFEMTVTYTTKALKAAFSKAVNDEAATKQKKKVNAL